MTPNATRQGPDSRGTAPARRRQTMGPWACLTVLASVLTSTALHAADEPKVYGLTLVPWSKEVEPGRYRSSRDWEGTLKYFREKFRGTDRARFWNEVNLPTVKYVHIQSLRPGSAWSGVNLYQLQNGEVRMYVLPRGEAPAPSRAEEASSDASAAGAERRPRRGAASR